MGVRFTLVRACQGGAIIAGRVGGSLAVSRALGDHSLKVRLRKPHRLYPWSSATCRRDIHPIR
eukprot:6202287-Pleurochrysis_carterae.AAC.2